MQWTVENLERNSTTGWVIAAHWRVSHTEGVASFAISASRYGTISFETPDPLPSTFTPYDSLTQKQVVDWVKAKLGAQQVEALESSIMTDIANQLTPPVLTGVPWSV